MTPRLVRSPALASGAWSSTTQSSVTSSSLGGGGAGVFSTSFFYTGIMRAGAGAGHST